MICTQNTKAMEVTKFFLVIEKHAGKNKYNQIKFMDSNSQSRLDPAISSLWNKHMALPFYKVQTASAILNSQAAVPQR